MSVGGVGWNVVKWEVEMAICVRMGEECGAKMHRRYSRSRPQTGLQFMPTAQDRVGWGKGETGYQGKGKGKRGRGRGRERRQRRRSGEWNGISARLFGVRRWGRGSGVWFGRGVRRQRRRRRRAGNVLPRTYLQRILLQVFVRSHHGAGSVPCLSRRTRPSGVVCLSA